MKELSIEEKAKCYDGAYKKVAIRFGSNVADEIFLKESEDEKVRKELIDFVKSRLAGFPQCDKYIAWLEKQGEHANFRNNIQIGDKVTHNEDGVLVNLSQLKRVAKKDEKKGEQKPSWSEEDEDILNTIINHFKVDIECTDEDDMVRWLKSLKDRVQPKQEWNEDDESRRKKIIHILSLDGRIKNEELSDINNWLKSFRPQNHWKPSDEQMKALEYAINCYSGISPTNIEEVYTLEIMKEQLKKLVEE